MSFLPENLDEIQEATAAPAGSYELQITACEETQTGENSKHPGAPMFKVNLGFVGEPNYNNIVHYISLPFEGDENANFKLLMLKRFLSLFHVAYSNNTEQLAMDMPGQTAQCEVTMSEPDDNGNVYNRLKIPRLRDEPKGEYRKPPRR